MGIFYGIVWFVIAIMLIWKMSKEDKIFYFLGGFFAFMGVWWIADDQLKDIDLLNGPYGYIMKAIGAVVLVIVGIYYYKNIYKKK